MENKKKKIDIILPNYNSHEFITKTIKSIINQSYTHWELTIVDDNSDKKTRDTLKFFLKYLLFFYQNYHLQS